MSPCAQLVDDHFQNTSRTLRNPVDNPIVAFLPHVPVDQYHGGVEILPELLWGTFSSEQLPGLCARSSLQGTGKGCLSQALKRCQTSSVKLQ